MTLFYGWVSTALRLQGHYKETVNALPKFLGVPDIDFIDPGRMKG